ncbi:MAG: amidohydrolase family protein, partial [Chlorobia bacterium]|nr:amidohydrolase family protein [Fimbriimonadaceae bacterium]
PTIFTCGPTIYQCQTVDEARKFVKEQSEAGYDGIKIYNDVSAEAFEALTESARQSGMMTVGHIPRSAGLKGVLQARMPIAHAEELMYTYLSPYFGKPKAEFAVAVKEAARMTVAAKVPLTATLVTYDHIWRQATDLPKLLSRAETKFLPSWELKGWQPGRNTYETRFKDPKAQTALVSRLQIQKDLIAEIHRLGGTIVVGTDSMCPGVVPGFSVPEEVANLASAGFSPYEALRAATLDPAQVLRQAKEFGSVSVGKRADLLLLDANPLVDLSNLRRRRGVMARGRWHSETVLQQRLAETPRQYDASFAKALNLLQNDPSALSSYLNQNDPMKRMTNQLFLETLKKGTDGGFARLLERIKIQDPKNPMGAEEFVNDLGYSLLKTEKEIDMAISIFGANVQFNPKSPNALDSLAEAYLDKGDKAKAIELYKKAIEIDPTFQNAKIMLKKLGG